MNWPLEALKKYAVFHGRARRKEFWIFFLCALSIALVVEFIEIYVREMGYMVASGWIGMTLLIYLLAVLTPLIAVTVRRLHDTDRSGWWLLITIIPYLVFFSVPQIYPPLPFIFPIFFTYLSPLMLIFSYIILFVFIVQDGKPGQNQYGANPKNVKKERKEIAKDTPPKE